MSNRRHVGARRGRRRAQWDTHHHRHAHYDDPGTPRAELTFDRGAVDGLATWWEASGEVLDSGHFNNDLRDGNWTATVALHPF